MTWYGSGESFLRISSDEENDEEKENRARFDPGAQVKHKARDREGGKVVAEGTKTGRQSRMYSIHKQSPEFNIQVQYPFFLPRSSNTYTYLPRY